MVFIEKIKCGRLTDFNNNFKGTLHMKVAMMQPTFLPWLGYFELISKADKFIFLDDFQLVYLSYHRRNRLFINKGIVDWYSTSVEKGRDGLKLLNKTILNPNNDWKQKLCRRMDMNYKKTPFYKTYGEALKEIILANHENLAVQNICIIKYLCSVFKYKVEFACSSDNKYDTARSERNLDMLRYYGADVYLSARGSFDYMKDEELFPVDDIEVLFQNFECKPYPQQSSIDGEFYPYLSTVDALFNIGAEETKRLIDNGTAKWDTWEDMIRSN